MVVVVLVSEETRIIRNALPKMRDDPDALMRVIERLLDIVESLQDENKKLCDRIDGLEREVKRPAAPFRIPDKKKKAKPGKPGRPKGHKGSFRPRPQQIDEIIEVPLERCPDCGGPLEGVTALEQYIEEIPVVRPKVTKLVTWRGQCPRCGEVRSTHPLQVSDAAGAAGTHLGPRALGVAMELTHGHGLTKRKACRVLDDLFGLKLTPGGLVQAAHRAAGKLGVRFEELERLVRRSAVAHADETSWWVGGPKWWLWVFANREATLYRVRQSRGREVVRETLGTDFGGVLVSDCLNIYDDVCALQQKCYAHHLKAVSEAMQRHPNGGEGFLRSVRAMLLAAAALKKAWPEMDEELRRRCRLNLDERARELLSPVRREPAEESVANRLRKQIAHLFTFLDHDGVDATNNLAERQLRPAVIARKVSCGNRTPRGARTWEILASLAATAAQHGESFAHIVSSAFRLQPAIPP